MEFAESHDDVSCGFFFFQFELLFVLVDVDKLDSYFIVVLVTYVHGVNYEIESNGHIAH